MKHATILLLAGCLMGWLANPVEAGQAERPNLILIMSDDIGIGGFSCCGSDKYRTPQIDALARSGIRFESCYAMPLCGPSRACLLTGRYGFRTGMLGNGSGRNVSPDREISIARVLQQEGYATGFAGKWNQLSYLSSMQDARRWGWDEYLMWDSMDKPGRYWNPRYYLNGKLMEGVDARYGPDLCHEFAVDFINRHKDRPFFFYYPVVLAHGPIMHTPDSGKKGKGQNLRGDNIAYLDKLIGKLVAELERQKLLEKTVIVFTSDNGTPGTDTIGGRTIEGAKGTMKEGGSRVPLIVSWKGKVAPGRHCQDLVDFSDVFPSLLELAGAKPPSGVTIDGRSFAPQCLGRPSRPREWIYVQLNANRYVRAGRWKLYGDGTLCDLKDAPFQEIVIPVGKEDQAAAEARKRLQGVLAGLK